jgi:hypothetical protein
MSKAIEPDARVEVPYKLQEVLVRTQLPVWLATLMAALLSVPATYAVLRAYEVLFRSEPNPALVVWSAHIAMFWRVGIAGYVAGMLAPLAYLAARRDLARFTRLLCKSVFVVGAMIGIQGLLMP